MSGNAPTTVVKSLWMRVLEATILFAPVGYTLLAALGGLVTLLSYGGSESAASQALGAGLVAVVQMAALGLVYLVLNPVALYLDATAVNEADLEWEPNAPLYSVGGFVLGGVVTLHYLYKRYQHTADGTTHAWTWYLVAQFLVIAPLSAVLMAVVHPVMLTPLALSAGALFVGIYRDAAVVHPVMQTLLALSAGAFLVGIYRDAAYVRTRSDGLLPNPVNWYLGVLFSVALFGVGPLLAGAYYLFRRRRAVRLTEERPTAGATSSG